MLGQKILVFGTFNLTKLSPESFGKLKFWERKITSTDWQVTQTLLPFGWSFLSFKETVGQFVKMLIIILLVSLGGVTASQSQNWGGRGKWSWGSNVPATISSISWCGSASLCYVRFLISYKL